jgi:hypothetical protein
LKGQIITNFIIEYGIDLGDEINYLTSTSTHGNFISLDFYPWKVYFIGLACKKGQGVGIVIISSNSVKFERLSRLNYYCTKNQAEYETLLFGLKILQSMQVKHVFFLEPRRRATCHFVKKEKGNPP